LLNEKFNDLKALLQKIRPIVPSTVHEHIDDFLKFVNTQRHAMSGAVEEFVEPVRTVMKVVAKKLDDHAWRVEVYRTNRGWIAPISESGSAKLISAKPPKWAKKLSGQMEFPPLRINDSAIEALIEAHPHHPQLKRDTIETFSRMRGGIRADVISGPAKFYRIVDPSNEGAGRFWISEANFHAIKNRDEWRSRFAVKPEWNQNGWFVEYELKAGETLPVWRGPAASQELTETEYYLEGGAEQLVFSPGSRDEMVRALPKVDSTGNADRRVDFTDVTGEIVPTNLRAHITDPHIKGPSETGWGATDYTPQEAKRILLTVPTPQAM
jgi:hypothetical protein